MGGRHEVAPPVFAREDNPVSLLAVSIYSHLLNLVILLLGLFLMLIILIQRGKGGGLAGAFGAAGGSSAFGSKAGDAFTRFTVIVAAIWVLMIMVHVRVADWDGHRPESAGLGSTKN